MAEIHHMFHSKYITDVTLELSDILQFPHSTFLFSKYKVNICALLLSTMIIANRCFLPFVVESLINLLYK